MRQQIKYSRHEILIYFFHSEVLLNYDLLLQRDREFILTNLNKFVSEEGFGESTWTIDLCYILERFRIKFKYTTITLGVDPGYCKEAFYNKVIAKDYDRVNRRFQQAESRGMEIIETSISFAEILTHLETSGPVIILTNANLLRCSRCSNYISCYPSCFSNVSYQGTVQQNSSQIYGFKQ